jgi:uncharacterized protein (DUF427 family)
MDAEAPTLVKDALHNPADPRHFMRIAPVRHLVVASAAGVELARSTRALKLKEVGHDIYDPVVYFPRADVQLTHLRRSAKTTHCPIKGDTEYFDLDAAGTVVADVAWSYTSVLPLASAIRDHVAFDTRKVNVLEYTAGSPPV